MEIPVYRNIGMGRYRIENKIIEDSILAKSIVNLNKKKYDSEEIIKNFDGLVENSNHLFPHGQTLIRYIYKIKQNFDDSVEITRLIIKLWNKYTTLMENHQYMISGDYRFVTSLISFWLQENC